MNCHNEYQTLSRLSTNNIHCVNARKKTGPGRAYTSCASPWNFLFEDEDLTKGVFDIESKSGQFRHLVNSPVNRSLFVFVSISWAFTSNTQNVAPRPPKCIPPFHSQSPKPKARRESKNQTPPTTTTATTNHHPPPPPPLDSRLQQQEKHDTGWLHGDAAAAVHRTSVSCVQYLLFLTRTEKI